MQIQILIILIIIILLLFILLFISTRPIKTPINFFNDKSIKEMIKSFDSNKERFIPIKIGKTPNRDKAIKEIINILSENNKQVFKNMLPKVMKPSFNPSKLGIYPMIYKIKKGGNANYVPDNFFDEVGEKVGYIYVDYTTKDINKTYSGEYITLKFNIIDTIS